VRAAEGLRFANCRSGARFACTSDSPHRASLSQSANITPVSSVFALCAAFSNALFVATQHVASTGGGTAKAKGLRLVASLIRSPLWLFGWAAGLGGFAFQAAALEKGQLSVVQALLVTELVFGLVLRRVWIKQSIKPVAWGAAALTCAGLAAFVVIDQPEGGTPTPSTHAWVVVLAVFGGAAAAMALAAGRGSPSRRAALYAAAAGIVWALVATFIKTATETLVESGVSATLSDWPIYALAGGGIAGIVLVQAALHVGPLSVSQPLLVLVDPTVSIMLSIWLFGEHYSHSPVSVGASLVAFAAMCAGAVALTRTAPPTMGVAPGDPTRA
jgi:drug/metabolite transporter (DMT)-like permease